jgi:hypothetical protein
VQRETIDAPLIDPDGRMALILTHCDYPELPGAR